MRFGFSWPVISENNSDPHTSTHYFQWGALEIWAVLSAILAGNQNPGTSTTLSGPTSHSYNGDKAGQSLI